MRNFEYHEYSSAVHWLEHIIETAALRKASDIHIDPYEDHATVRLRVDGVLESYEKVLPHIHLEGIGRLKILAELKSDEHMAPQDGRFRCRVPGIQPIDVRLSIIPSYFGESAVLRLLANTAEMPTCSELGISEEDEKKIREALEHTSGIILVTGPTGSGKTTTLYTLLRILNNGSRSIITIEDPIEYAIPGIRQIQVNQSRSISFASGLRALLRQDPDVIMVGEIRDAETAAMAVHTALTGHLVLATLHTTDAVTAIPRLIDMGVEPYLINSTLSLVMSQRLVRRKCRCENGCSNCNFGKFRGRVGIYEILAPSPTLQEAVNARSSAHTLASIALKEGLRTMEHDGCAKAERGITTLEEVISVLSK